MKIRGKARTLIECVAPIISGADGIQIGLGAKFKQLNAQSIYG
jgi:hypothetical protein